MRVFLLIFFQIYLVQCQVAKKEYTYSGKKSWGVSLAAPPHELDSQPFEKIQSLGANAITLMPYAFLPKNEAQIRFTYDGSKHQQWWGETPEGIRKCIDLAHTQNLEVLLKPHLWIGSGAFTGDLTFKNNTDWNAYEDTYTAYILQFAKIAEEKHTAGFCIGTELASHVKNRPEFWLRLISETRKVYHGKLTYAENWDTYTKVPFWKELDYIGVDAYFPLSDKIKPSINDIREGWQKHKKDLKKLSSELQKPILFTEIGYRSNEGSLEKPWETDYSKPLNEEIQANAYQAFFEEIATEEWFAGGYVWKWIAENHSKYEARDSFTPQGKKAEKTIENNFKRLKN